MSCVRQVGTGGPAAGGGRTEAGEATQLAELHSPGRGDGQQCFCKFMVVDFVLRITLVCLGRPWF